MVRRDTETADRFRAELQDHYLSIGVPTHFSWRSPIGARQYGYLFSILGAFAPPGTAVLDWGCGDGVFSLWLASQGCRVSGLEFYPPVLDPVIQETSPGLWDFHMAEEPVKLPYEDHSFDLVLSIGVLEHVRDTGGTESGSLAEVKRVLRPGGRFVCYHFPNRGSWIEFAARRTRSKNWHRQRYSKREVSDLFRGSGFEIDETFRYGLLPRNSVPCPTSPRWARALADVYDFLDTGGQRIANGLVQNHLVVCRPRPGIA
ncbi:MAG: hypothetical protein QOG54_2476 [Actinomycetota bacterium]|jgi:SAM-dependent methyltransferase|nr:hypothetical protein [Actinomycetota bacterium]